MERVRRQTRPYVGAMDWYDVVDTNPFSAPVRYFGQVDMNDYTGTFTTVHVNGTFNNWCGACNPMSDDDGDNIWTLTISLPDASYEYKYAIGNWVSQEMVPVRCDNTIGANRLVTVNGDAALTTTLYNGCPGDYSSLYPDDDTDGGDVGGVLDFEDTVELLFFTKEKIKQK